MVYKEVWILHICDCNKKCETFMVFSNKESAIKEFILTIEHDFGGFERDSSKLGEEKIIEKGSFFIKDEVAVDVFPAQVND